MALKLRTRFKLWLSTVQRIYKLQRLVVVLQGELSTVEEFMGRHPKTAKLVQLYARMMNKWEDLSLPLFQRLHNLKYWYRTAPHSLQINSLNRADYNECEHVMLHSCFQILVDYVEIEIPLEAALHDNKFKTKTKYGTRMPELALEFLREYSSHSKYAEILYLYTWWLDVAVPRYHSDERVSKELAGQITRDPEHGRFELEANTDDFIRSQEEEMLMRLLKIRSELWT